MYPILPVGTDDDRTARTLSLLGYVWCGPKRTSDNPALLQDVDTSHRNGTLMWIGPCLVACSKPEEADTNPIPIANSAKHAHKPTNMCGVWHAESRHCDNYLGPVDRGNEKGKYISNTGGGGSGQIQSRPRQILSKGGQHGGPGTQNPF